MKSNEFYSEELLRNLHFEFTDDGGIIIFGNYTDENNQVSVFATKLDQDFKVLWRKNFGFQEGGGNNLKYAKVTKDNGFVMLGSKLRYEFPSGFDFFLVKTDCNGNLEWDNQSCVLPSEEDVVLIGNPVTDSWLMHFPHLQENETITFELVNAMGQVIRRGVSLGPILHENIGELSAGMYIYTLKTSNQTFYSGKIQKL